MLEMLIVNIDRRTTKVTNAFLHRQYSLANNIRWKLMHDIFAINLNSSLILHSGNKIDTNIINLKMIEQINHFIMVIMHMTSWLAFTHFLYHLTCKSYLLITAWHVGWSPKLKAHLQALIQLLRASWNLKNKRID